MMQDKIVDITIAPELRDDLESIRRIAMKKAGMHADTACEISVLRRSIDARKKQPRYVLRVALAVGDQEHATPPPPDYPDVSAKPVVHIIGAGPAGYFAALELIVQGFKPVILERGKDVRERRRDLRAIQQFGVVNPDSNYCFGEGGAGTYSDGKLYTRATKRGNVRRVLEILTEHGAHPDILVDAHPHIGSNKLPQIVSAIRNTIEQAGGAVHFNTRVTDFTITDGRISRIHAQGDITFDTESVILATGHSARDIYQMLAEKSVAIEFKPFALGVRIEHPQLLIDEMQYGQPRGNWLPAAAYSLTCQVGKRGVFSFCMCPGGLIVPAATAPGEIVVNGMSLSRRDSPFANSGMVTTIGEGDLMTREKGPLAGMAFQSAVERRCFDAGDGSQRAPAQRLVDFLQDVPSSSLPETSYIPGVYSASLKDLLPQFVTEALRAGFTQFGKTMPGYVTSEAVILATESRTSAPVRIPRHPDTLMHPEVRGLYPCGEGAGYAGGIVSAALEGQNVARAVVTHVTGKQHPV